MEIKKRNNKPTVKKVKVEYLKLLKNKNNIIEKNKELLKRLAKL